MTSLQTPQAMSASLLFLGDTIRGCDAVEWCARTKNETLLLSVPPPPTMRPSVAAVALLRGQGNVAASASPSSVCRRDIDVLVKRSLDAGAWRRAVALCFAAASRRDAQKVLPTPALLHAVLLRSHLSGDRKASMMSQALLETLEPSRQQFALEQVLPALARHSSAEATTLLSHALHTHPAVVSRMRCEAVVGTLKALNDAQARCGALMLPLAMASDALDGVPSFPAESGSDAAAAWFASLKLVATVSHRSPFQPWSFVREALRVCAGLGLWEEALRIAAGGTSSSAAATRDANVGGCLRPAGDTSLDMVLAAMAVPDGSLAQSRPATMWLRAMAHFVSMPSEIRRQPWAITALSPHISRSASLWPVAIQLIGEYVTAAGKGSTAAGHDVDAASAVSGALLASARRTSDLNVVRRCLVAAFRVAKSAASNESDFVRGGAQWSLWRSLSHSAIAVVTSWLTSQPTRTGDDAFDAVIQALRLATALMREAVPDEAAAGGVPRQPSAGNRPLCAKDDLTQKEWTNWRLFFSAVDHAIAPDRRCISATVAPMGHSQPLADAIVDCWKAFAARASQQLTSSALRQTVAPSEEFSDAVVAALGALLTTLRYREQWNVDVVPSYRELCGAMTDAARARVACQCWALCVMEGRDPHDDGGQQHQQQQQDAVAARLRSSKMWIADAALQQLATMCRSNARLVPACTAVIIVACDAASPSSDDPSKRMSLSRGVLFSSAFAIAKAARDTPSASRVIEALYRQHSEASKGKGGLPLIATLSPPTAAALKRAQCLLSLLPDHLRLQMSDGRWADGLATVRSMMDPSLAAVAPQAGHLVSTLAAETGTCAAMAIREELHLEGLRDMFTERTPRAPRCNSSPTPVSTSRGSSNVAKAVALLREFERFFPATHPASRALLRRCHADIALAEYHQGNVAAALSWLPPTTSDGVESQWHQSGWPSHAVYVSVTCTIAADGWTAAQARLLKFVRDSIPVATADVFFSITVPAAAAILDYLLPLRDGTDDEARLRDAATTVSLLGAAWRSSQQGAVDGAGSEGKGLSSALLSGAHRRSCPVEAFAAWALLRGLGEFVARSYHPIATTATFGPPRPLLSGGTTLSATPPRTAVIREATEEAATMLAVESIRASGDAARDLVYLAAGALATILSTGTPLAAAFAFSAHLISSAVQHDGERVLRSLSPGGELGEFFRALGTAIGRSLVANAVSSKDRTDAAYCFTQQGLSKWQLLFDELARPMSSDDGDATVIRGVVAIVASRHLFEQLCSIHERCNGGGDDAVHYTMPLGLSSASQEVLVALTASSLAISARLAMPLSDCDARHWGDLITTECAAHRAALSRWCDEETREGLPEASPPLTVSPSPRPTDAEVASRFFRTTNANPSDVILAQLSKAASASTSSMTIAPQLGLHSWLGQAGAGAPFESHWRAAMAAVQWCLRSDEVAVGRLTIRAASRALEALPPNAWAAALQLALAPRSRHQDGMLGPSRQEAGGDGATLSSMDIILLVRKLCGRGHLALAVRLISLLEDEPARSGGVGHRRKMGGSELLQELLAGVGKATAAEVRLAASYLPRLSHVRLRTVMADAMAAIDPAAVASPASCRTAVHSEPLVARRAEAMHISRPAIPSQPKEVTAPFWTDDRKRRVAAHYAWLDQRAPASDPTLPGSPTPIHHSQLPAEVLRPFEEVAEKALGNRRMAYRVLQLWYRRDGANRRHLERVFRMQVACPAPSGPLASEVASEEDVTTIVRLFPTLRRASQEAFDAAARNAFGGRYFGSTLRWLVKRHAAEIERRYGILSVPLPKGAAQGDPDGVPAASLDDSAARPPLALASDPAAGGEAGRTAVVLRLFGEICRSGAIFSRPACPHGSDGGAHPAAALVASALDALNPSDRSDAALAEWARRLSLASGEPSEGATLRVHPLIEDAVQRWSRAARGRDLPQLDASTRLTSLQLSHAMATTGVAAEGIERDRIDRLALALAARIDASGSDDTGFRDQNVFARAVLAHVHSAWTSFRRLREPQATMPEDVSVLLQQLPTALRQRCSQR